VVLVDGDGEPVTPAVIWCDGRSATECREITERVGAQRLIELTSNPALVGFSAPKLLWIRKHLPEAFARARRFLLPKDYVRFKLTGEAATEVSDASGTLLFDVEKRRWSREMLEALELDASLLPSVHESPAVSARVSAAGAAALGIPAGTPVVGGGGDQAAGAVGTGIVRAGVISSTIGTSGVVFAYSAAPVRDPKGRVHTFCHAVPGAWHVMGVTQGAGLSLQWFRNQLAPGMDYDALTAEAAKTSCCSQGLFWLPYLMGERTPHLDATARGGWIGLTNSHTRADLVRALIEGVSYSQRDCLDIIEELGVTVNSVRASGGGAQSPFWRRLLANILNKRVVTLETQEGSAYGAALLALAGTGAYASVPEVCRVAIRETDSISAEPNDAAFYEKGHQVYQALYPALKPIYSRIAAL